MYRGQQIDYEMLKYYLKYLTYYLTINYLYKIIRRIYHIRRKYDIDVEQIIKHLLALFTFIGITRTTLHLSSLT